MGGIAVVTLDLGISREADQSGADRSPCAFGQGDGGEGLGGPGGGHRFGWCGELMPLWTLLLALSMV